MKEALLALPAAWMRASTATCWCITSLDAHKEMTASIIPDISRVLLPTSLGPWRSTDTVWMARSLASKPERLKFALYRKTLVWKLVRKTSFWLSASNDVVKSSFSVNSLYVFFTQFVKVLPLFVALQVTVEFAKQDRAAHVGVVCKRWSLWELGDSPRHFQDFLQSCGKTSG